MKNVITLGKLIGLLLYCLPLLLSVNVHTKNTRNVLAHPVMGTIFLVIASGETLSGLFNRDSRYICVCVHHRTYVIFTL